MALKDTIKTMRDLLEQISSDLPKADNGNKAASQRVRTGTVKLEKTAKKYRKESILAEKGTKGRRKPAAKKTAKRTASRGKSQTRTPKRSQRKAQHSKMKSKHMTSRPSALSIKRSRMAKRPTAKLARKSAR